jgi:hypothetical protein
MRLESSVGVVAIDISPVLVVNSLKKPFCEKKNSPFLIKEHGTLNKRVDFGVDQGQDTLSTETIMWSKWGVSIIPFGRGDLHITHPEL